MDDESVSTVQTLGFSSTQYLISRHVAQLRLLESLKAFAFHISMADNLYEGASRC
jgi:hypothetical protein